MGGLAESVLHAAEQGWNRADLARDEGGIEEESRKTLAYDSMGS